MALFNDRDILEIRTFYGLWNDNKKGGDSMKALHIIAFILVIIGGLNWGLQGLFEFNLVHTIFQFSYMVERIVYVLVGLSAIVLLVTHAKDCKTCMMK